MEIKGIQKARAPWVKPVAAILAAGIMVYEIMQQQWLYVPFAQLVEQVLSGEIKDAKTIVAVLKTKLLLGL